MVATGLPMAVATGLPMVVVKGLPRVVAGKRKAAAKVHQAAAKGRTPSRRCARRCARPLSR